jgi:hypothetical protein
MTAGLLLGAASSSAFAAIDTSSIPAGTVNSGPVLFNAGDLVVTSSYYEGTASNLVAGSTLAGSTAGVTSTAVAAGSSYLNVWNNTTPDGSFGITSPIIVSDVNASTGAVNTNYNLTNIAATQGINLVTSFSSKSELSVNLSTGGNAFTLNGYATTVGQIDVSNSNTPGVIDTSNPTVGISAPTYRSIAQLNTDGSLQVTNTNAYSGNNGRSTILDTATNTYYITGNAGNSGKPVPAGELPILSANTGVQSIQAGSNNGTIAGTTNANATTTVVGALTADGQHGFSVTQTGAPSDKVGKDDNFRGETVFNNTLYVTKGSGGNGVDTVYQVGATGSLDSLAANGATTPISILPGFPTGLASATPTNYPFGLWFANANTLFVADEGAGGKLNASGNIAIADGSLNATAAGNGQAGLEEWVLGTNGVWTEAHVWQAGLNLGVSYSVSGTALGVSGTYSAATDGLRTLIGQVNADGSYTLYSTTSTISNSGDQGADPNKLVAITIAANSTGTESFTTLQTAAYGEVLRGVAVAPVPLPPSLLMMLSGLGITGLFARRNKRA